MTGGTLVASQDSQSYQIKVKNPCNAGDMGSIPGSGRSPGEGSGNPLQNLMDRGASRATVYGVTKELDN